MHKQFQERLQVRGVPVGVPRREQWKGGYPFNAVIELVFIDVVFELGPIDSMPIQAYFDLAP